DQAVPATLARADVSGPEARAEDGPPSRCDAPRRPATLNIALRHAAGRRTPRSPADRRWGDVPEAALRSQEPYPAGGCMSMPYRAAMLVRRSRSGGPSGAGGNPG